jgi:PAS domain S-box-containing protein
VALAALPAPAEGVLERLLASLSAPLFGVDKNGICSYLSPAWEQFSGFSASDALGKPLADCFADADRRAVSALLVGIGNGTALRFEQQGALRRKEGDPLWVEISVAPLTAPDGALIGACGVIREAAELRRARDQAEADGVRLLLLVDEIDTAVILEDAEGNIQQANAALCTLFSLDAAPYSLEGMPVNELLESAARRFIGPEGFLRRVSELRAAKQDAKGESFVMGDGRVVEQDYLEVTVGEVVVGHLWLFRDMLRAPARAVP